MRRTLAFLFVTGTFAACAQGSDIESGFEEIGGGGVGGEGGEPGQTTSATSGSSTSTTSTSSTSTSTSSTSTSGAGGSGAGGSGSGGAPCDFGSPNQCAGAQELTQIDGDQGSDLRTATGHTSKWFKIFVAEGVSSLISYPQLSYTATLESPAATNYDLYVYPGGSGSVDCGASPLHGAGSPEQVSQTWGDSIGSDDGTWFAIEVRHVDGDDCSSDWTLSFEGHTNP